MISQAKLLFSQLLTEKGLGLLGGATKGGKKVNARRAKTCTLYFDYLAFPPYPFLQLTKLSK